MRVDIPSLFTASPDSCSSGVTNQRETTVVWSRKTGKPLSRAIVWDDTRIRGLVAQYEKKLAEQGVEVEGKIQKGPKALRKLYVTSFSLSSRHLISVSFTALVSLCRRTSLRSRSAG